MKNIIRFSSKINIVRIGSLVCILCFALLCGCSENAPSCEITVSGPGSLCQIQYTDSDGVEHNVIIQADSDIITIEDCDEVSNVDCS